MKRVSSFAREFLRSLFRPKGMTMRAAVYDRIGTAAEVLRIEQRSAPEPGPGELRVRLAYSGINPSDVKTHAGMSSRASTYAEVIPHSDGAGIVDAAGPGAPIALVGKRVWVYNAQWERPLGTAAEYVSLPARQVVSLPDSVTLEQGAAIGIPLMTAFHGVEACGSLLARTVLVPGAAGSVGYYATQLARMAGARVIALVSSKDKAAIARRAGATEAIDYRREDTGRRVRELTSGRGARTSSLMSTRPVTRLTTARCSRKAAKRSCTAPTRAS